MCHACVRMWTYGLGPCQDTKPLAKIPEAPSSSLRDEAEAACLKLERGMSSNNIDLLEACIMHARMHDSLMYFSNHFKSDRIHSTT